MGIVLLHEPGALPQPQVRQSCSEIESENPIKTFQMRALWASFRSVSHARSCGARKAAVAGASASVQPSHTPKTAAGRPSARNSHCQPARPRKPSRASNPAASGAPITCISIRQEGVQPAGFASLRMIWCNAQAQEVSHTGPADERAPGECFMDRSGSTAAGIKVGVEQKQC